MAGPIVSLVKIRAGRTWLYLVAATVISFTVGVEHDSGSSSITLVVLAIAALKMRLVGLDFMELRRAPRLLRAAFELYCYGLWALLCGLDLWL